MSKRLEMLQKLTTNPSGQRDPFAHYALAMELKGLGRLRESLAAFEALRALDAKYVAQYLMAGGVAEALGRNDEARRWYDEGIVCARVKGDAHTLSELQQALALFEAKVVTR